MKKPIRNKAVILTASLLLQLGAFCFNAPGGAGDVDLSFDPGSGVNGPVTAMAVQPDGKVIIGGQFTVANGLVRTNLARLNPDGSGDPTFNPPALDYGVDALALQPDGKLLIGSKTNYTECYPDFGCYDFVLCSVTRLNGNGTADGTFTPATGYSDSYSGYIAALAVQPDGKVLVGGAFTSMAGTNHNGIVRLKTNGTLDTSFNPGTGIGGYQVSVGSIVLQSNGQVLIGGSFTSFNGTNRIAVARLNSNGSLDPAYDPSAEFGGDFARVDSIVVQPDGKAVVAGSFTNVNGNCLARLNVNGNRDNSFDPGTGANGIVSSVALQPDGKMLIGGGFTTLDGTNCNRIARLTSNGSLDMSFDPGTGADSAVRTLILQTNGQVLVSGSFTKFNGVSRSRVAQLNPDGSVDDGFDAGPGLERATSALALQADGKVLIGGPFVYGSPWFGPAGDVLAFVNGTNQYGRIRLNADGSMDDTFTSNPQFTPDLPAIFYDVCSEYPSLGCSPSAWTSRAVAQPDGKVLVAGIQQTALTSDEGGDILYNWLFGRFNEDGSWDGTFSPSTNLTAGALALQPDGKVVIGGYISVNGTNSSVFRLNANGSLDGSFQLGQFTAEAFCLGLQSDGKVVVGSRNGLARLNDNGSLDVGFAPVLSSNGIVNCLVIQPDGKLVIAGTFTGVNGTNRHNLARLNANGSLDTSFDPGLGPDGVVHSIALQPDGNILIGGEFLNVNGVMRRYAARLYGDVPPPLLSIVRSNATVVVSWPSPSTGFVLQQNTDLTLSDWTAPLEAVSDDGTTRSLTVSAASGPRFYRLFRP